MLTPSFTTQPKLSVLICNKKYLYPWKSSTGGEGDSNGRIEMGAGDVSNRVDHDHNDKPPHHTDTRKCNTSFTKIHHH